jgi:hypothetical protein
MRILSTRKILVSGLAALSLVLAGCLTDDKDDADEGAPVITTHPANQTIIAGGTVTFLVAATGDSPLRYTWVDADGDTIQDSTAASLIGEPPASDNGIQVRCIVSNAKGSATSNSATLTITGLTNWPAATVLSVGAQGAVPGSAVDLDSGKVWLSGMANANKPSIDVVFLYYDSAFSLNGAAAARDSGVKYGITLTDGYGTTVQNIKFVQVTEKPGSQEAAAEWYMEADAQGDTERSVQVEAGDKFLVKTTGGDYVYLEITSFTGSGTTATSLFTVSLSSL